MSEATAPQPLDNRDVEQISQDAEARNDSMGEQSIRGEHSSGEQRTFSPRAADCNFPVTVYGSFLPRHIFYRLHAVCAYLRCIFVAICLLVMWPSFDVVVADQVSVIIPLSKLKSSMKQLSWRLEDEHVDKHSIARDIV
ncbi:hypothetical protein H6P81_006665 [Aristolochia fimbriata]|uniref:Uncharacterized protein n=1 Tax=Aristolochia fimbriata TaxID=158543 RepID=A0AAV7F0P4_ARIFI|nr:hypothetical protein H6P81_006665 [Aristolochia fimbriata]